MNSIDQNQKGNHKENLQFHEAGGRIKEMAESAKSCFLCTSNATGDSDGVRPMSIQKVDDDGTIWFLSAKDSHKNEEIARNEEVKLYFQGSAHSDFLYLKGRAAVSDEPAKIAELWTPLAKAWFTEGEKDPRISVIKFVPQEGFYWDNKHGNLIAGAKMLFGALTGQTIDDSVYGEIKA